MTIAGWYRSWISGWRLRRALAINLCSLRSVDADLWLPVRRMSDDEVDASIVIFRRLARMHSMPIEYVAEAVRVLREAQADARQLKSDPQP